MLLGLVTDVHSHAAELAQALKVLRKRGVDQVITLGDTCDVFAPSDGSAEITSMLAQCGAIGVWGNHDYTLCRDPPDDFRQRFTAQTLEWMSHMQPSLEIDGCYFSHRAADIDPHDIAALWSCEEETIDLHKRAIAGFRCVSHQRQFIGHYHQWALMSPAGRNEWRGKHPIYLTPGVKHFVVVDAIFNGSCAVFNTTTGWLEPQHFETPQGSGRRFWAGETGRDQD